MKYIFKSKLILMISQIGTAMKRKNLKIGQTSHKDIFLHLQYDPPLWNHGKQVISNIHVGPKYIGI